MRDYIVITIIAVICVSALRKPIHGLYGWFLVSFMNVHKLAWGLATSLRPGVLVTAATLAGTILNPQPLTRLTKESFLILSFWIFTIVTTLLAVHPDMAWEKWIIFSKIILFYFLTIHLVRDSRHLRQMLIVTTLCLGFYGAKGGVFSILTGGSYRVYGPEGSFIEDNNELALALNMTLPIIIWLAQTSAKRWHAIGLYSIAALSVLSIVFSFSRGGMLTLVFVALMLFWNSGKRFQSLALLVFCGLLAGAYIGQKWTSRMQTISSYKTEGSAAGRLEAWDAAIDFARDHPLTGGGFGAMTRDVYESYGFETGIVSHSIYFGTLAEQGFPGLILYLLIFISAILSLKECKNRASNKIMQNLAAMLRVSLIAFLIGGAFYERQYFDYAFFFISVVTILKLVIEQEDQASSQPEVISNQIPNPVALR